MNSEESASSPFVAHLLQSWSLISHPLSHETFHLEEKHPKVEEGQAFYGWWLLGAEQVLMFQLFVVPVVPNHSEITTT